VPLSPSATATLPTESAGAVSSSMIVPVPVPSAITALTAFDRFSVYVSFASSRVSPLTTTVTVFVVSPTAKLSVPLTAV
jgi:hypothetical protein